MGTHIAGKYGDVLLYTATGTYATDTAIIAGIKSWTLDFTMDALDTTDFGDLAHKTYIPGLDGWSGSFEGFKDAAPLALGNTPFLELRESSSTTTQLWKGNALITGLHETVAVDGIASISYDYIGSGTLTSA